MLLLSALKVYDINAYYLKNESEELLSLKQSNTWILPSIYINNNWSSTNSTYDWCNYENGYFIIENVTISAGGYPDTGITIDDTQDRFIIRNCILENVFYGISLNNVSNGNLIDNELKGGNCFVDANFCQNITILGNYHDKGYRSFRFHECNFCRLINNSITSIYLGVYGQICNNITVIDNIFQKGTEIFPHPISFVGSSNITILSNLIDSCSIGIALYEVTNSQLKNNEIGNSLLAGSIKVCNNISIIENIIGRTSGNGLYLDASNYCKIFNNTLQDINKIGIYLHISNSCLIMDNLINSHLECIVEDNCYGNTIENNMCHIFTTSIPGYGSWFFIGIMCIIIISVLKKREYYRNDIP
jgi:parallel beta-helix repeat protein